MAKPIQRVPSGVLLIKPAMANVKCRCRTGKVGVAPVILAQEHMEILLTIHGMDHKRHKGADNIIRKIRTMELHFACGGIDPDEVSICFTASIW